MSTIDNESLVNLKGGLPTITNGSSTYARSDYMCIKRPRIIVSVDQVSIVDQGLAT
jgi:hypothetical protein